MRHRARFNRRCLSAAILTGLCLSALVFCGRAASPPLGARRVVIVAVDGASWDVMSPLLSEGRLPYLAALYRSGSAGLMRSVEPMDPAALWTSVATGRAPADHGIQYAVEKIPGRYAIRPVTAARRRAPALWTIASASGITSGTSNWPQTFPVETVLGFMISEGYDPRLSGDRGYIFPEGALGSGGGEGEPLALSQAVARLASLDEPLLTAFQQDLAALSRALVLYRVHQPRLAFFRFLSVDLVSHRYWHYHEPRYLVVARARGERIERDRAEALAGAVPGAYAFVDECLGMMLQRLPEETALLIVSDHGFRGALTTDFLHVDLNGLLHRLGDFERGEHGGADWGRTRAFNLEDTGSAVRGIHLNIEGREQRGSVARRETAALKESLGRSLRSLVSSKGDPLFLTVRVVEDPAPGSPDIELTENLAIDPLGTIPVGGDPPVLVRDLFRRYDEAFGAHDASGMLLAAGSGIAKGHTGWSADLYDVAPTVLYLLGLPLDAAMRGQPIAAILERAPAGDYPVTDSYERLPSAPAPAPQPDAAAEKELRGLRDRGHLR